MHLFLGEDRVQPPGVRRQGAAGGQQCRKDRREGASQGRCQSTSCCHGLKGRNGRQGIMEMDDGRMAGAKAAWEGVGRN
jgi:hypothetical protein